MSKKSDEILPTIKSTMDTLKQQMRDDHDYAQGWHDNLAMMCADAICTSLEDDELRRTRHDDANDIGNDAASRFMKLCFGVEKSKTNTQQTNHEETETLAGLVFNRVTTGKKFDKIHIATEQSYGTNVDHCVLKSSSKKKSKKYKIKELESRIAALEEVIRQGVMVNID